MVKRINFHKAMFICFVIILFQAALDFPALAGGSMGYNDLRAKFPDDKLLFETLEQVLDIEDGVWAFTRIGPCISPKFGAMRLGPYYVCARQKSGERLFVLVTIATENTFIDKKGRRTESPDRRTFRIEEKMIGAQIERGSKKHPNYPCYEREIKKARDK